MTYAAYLETEEEQYIVTAETWEDVESLILREFEGCELLLGHTFVIENNQRREDLELVLEETVLEFIKQQESV